MKDADVLLRIPARVAPSKKQKALNNATQTHIQSVNVSGSGSTFGFYAEINMLDDILNITSPSHFIKVKKFGGKAAVTLVGEPAMLDKDLTIVIFLFDLNISAD